MTNGSDYEGTATIPLRRLKELEENENKFLENLKPLDERIAQLEDENATLKKAIGECKNNYEQLEAAYSLLRSKQGYEESYAARKIINKIKIHINECSFCSSLDAELDNINVGFFARHLSEAQKDSIKQVFSNKLLDIIKNIG